MNVIETNLNLPTRTDPQPDHMPAEVATALLAAPAAKMTGAFRRACWAARSLYWAAPVPLVRNPEEQGPHYVAGRDKRQTLEDRMRDRAARGSAAQLLKWERRALARARTAERKANALLPEAVARATSLHLAAGKLRAWAEHCDSALADRWHPWQNPDGN